MTTNTYQNIVIDQGATFNETFALINANNEPYNVTNMTAASKIRKTFSNTTFVSFTTILETGLVTISLSPSQTANLVSGRYYYDIMLTDNNANTVTRIVQGQAEVSPSVTI